MTVIRQQDFIDSIEDALQFISYYHPLDYVKAVEKAYLKEESQAAKDAMAQILINSRMSAEGKRPLCQDTGIVTCFVKIGMAVSWDKTDMTVQQMVDEGTRRAYMNPDNPLRASIVADPAGARKNTKDNTPAVVHIDNSCRVQTVREQNNQRFYNLIKEFYKITKCPVLLNTSFNVKGQPIVNKPDQAIKCFLSTKIDILVMENYIITK